MPTNLSVTRGQLFEKEGEFYRSQKNMDAGYINDYNDLNFGNKIDFSHLGSRSAFEGMDDESIAKSLLGANQAGQFGGRTMVGQAAPVQAQAETGPGAAEPGEVPTQPGETPVTPATPQGGGTVLAADAAVAPKQTSLVDIIDSRPDLQEAMKDPNFSINDWWNNHGTTEYPGVGLVEPGTEGIQDPLGLTAEAQVGELNSPETKPDTETEETQEETPEVEEAEAVATGVPTELLASIRSVLGQDWKPPQVFMSSGLVNQGIYGAMRVEGTPNVFTIGPGGGMETAESYRAKFGTDSQEGIVDIISREKAVALNIDSASIDAAPKVAPTVEYKDKYSTMFEEMGLPDIKDQIAGIDKEMKELDEGFADDVQKINDNPWLSEAARTDRIRNKQEAYETKRNAATNRLQLMDSILDDGRQQIQWQLGHDLDLAQFEQSQLKFLSDQAESASDLGKNLVSLQGGLFDVENKSWVVAPKSSSGSSSGSGGVVTVTGDNGEQASTFNYADLTQTDVKSLMGKNSTEKYALLKSKLTQFGPISDSFLEEIISSVTQALRAGVDLETIRELLTLNNVPIQMLDTFDEVLNIESMVSGGDTGGGGSTPSFDDF